MSSNVNGLDGFKNQSAASANGNTRAEVILVKKGENIAIIAKRFGMSKEEFIKWTGLKGINERVGQKIKLPTAKIEKGKGIYALARKYNMTMDEFCKLNNIKDRQNYQAKAGEVFYVKNNNKKSIKIPKNSAKSSKSDVKPSSAAAGGAIIGNVVGKLVENKNKWNSSYSPDEIANKLYEIADNSWGAVGRPDFDALIKEINPKNVSEVLESYVKNKNNKDKESLIYTITHEIKSNKSARKAAVMKIYDAIAAKKNAPATRRKEFEKELNQQFSGFGMVNTQRLDGIVAELLKLPSKKVYIKKIYMENVTKSNLPGSRQVKLSEKSKYPNQTVASLHKQAIQGADKKMRERFKEYCEAHKLVYTPDMLDTTALSRIPKPVLDSQGRIVPYVSEILKPKVQPNGKVVVVNSGHGGYNPNNGSFDVGSFSFVKKDNGKYAPHIEYDKVQQYALSMSDWLRDQGYAVVLTQGNYLAYSHSKALTSLYNDLASGKKAGGQKYSKNDIALVSFHADSSDKTVDENDRSSVCYCPGHPETFKLAEKINYNLNHNEGTWVKSGLEKRTTGTKQQVWILTESSPQIPAVLLETAHINGAKGRSNLDAWLFREKFVDSAVQGLNQYFGLN